MGFFFAAASPRGVLCMGMGLEVGCWLSSFPVEKDRIPQQTVGAVILMVVLAVTVDTSVATTVAATVAKDLYSLSVDVCRGRKSRRCAVAEKYRCTLLRFVVAIAALEIAAESAAFVTETATRQLIARFIS